MSTGQKPAGRTSAGAPGRRPYRTPELKEYGSISKLTQSGPGSDMEGGTSNRIMTTGMCL